ncbi:hypothetical protein [Yersinia frederiksenii]|uniref:hypothetical protein n=1 Tax=Yersinia frederiksenii TaxID=29484 RepID=UPI000680A7B5|nr:hypothetical protein [Yersinia frederiksenii]
MNTPDTAERCGVFSAGGFLPAVKAAMAIGHLQAQGVASWDENPKGRDSFAGSVRSMTARPDAQRK